ncbi:biotin--[acetyl-CoA-carboxylase] ligase [Acidisoma cellulosilytica]|uniref:biotin--[biotin carboxyl-carrier protein] ligase n=1 Tax=Acidisoma cellulosilyticum TaxID=2802395 RepID=A0A963Z3H3_9PROT|nr:biotin--[acetyl-CoA-carboxylase] ligase [Acidisoma cellulosilyticum]MCB8881876.1 biotin--[acetyl-CoA-carboxylase] ligase [Acidisoma cellulosilyticum]
MTDSVAADLLPLASGYRLEEVQLIPSTSDACIARVHEGAADGLAILAAAQSAARGSRGRSWSAPLGNLYLSVLLRPRNAAEAGGAGQWALLAGLAFVEALSAYDADPEQLTVKWPNDVLRAGAKLGGVLVDAGMGKNGLDWLVIGVGANLAVAPVVTGRLTAAILPRAGTAPSPRDVAHSFIARIAYWRGLLAERGFAPIRSAWMARAHPIGTPIAVRDARGDSMAEGTFAGLSETGELLLSMGETTRAISTGDVLLGQGS